MAAIVIEERWLLLLLQVIIDNT